MIYHNSSGCRLEPCTRCADFNGGWVAGKQKLAAEVDAVLTARHAVDCGCTPCGVVASVAASLAHDAIRDRVQQLNVALDALVAKAQRGGDAAVGDLLGGSEADVWDALLADVETLADV